MSGRGAGRRLHRADFPAAPGWLSDPLAHRGLHGPAASDAPDAPDAADGPDAPDAPDAADGPGENTLEAFAAARDAGYGVELDVRLAADGVPVVHHDATLPDGRAICRTPSGALPPHVPALAVALGVLRHVPVMVELKQDGVRIGALERAVAEVLERHRGPHCIASFSPASVAWFARLRPATVRVLTVSDQDDARMPVPLRGRIASLRPLGLLRPHAVSFDVRGLPTPATVRWREEGGVLTAWTVRDAATLAVAHAHADGMIFEGLRP